VFEKETHHDDNGGRRGAKHAAPRFDLIDDVRRVPCLVRNDAARLAGAAIAASVRGAPSPFQTRSRHTGPI